jgi:hypothetical protein
VLIQAHDGICDGNGGVGRLIDIGHCVQMFLQAPMAVNVFLGMLLRS